MQQSFNNPANGRPGTGGQRAQSGGVPRNLRMRAMGSDGGVSDVRARILWPALGFPAVIAPKSPPSVDPFANGDATRCICVLVLTDKPTLSKAEAAKYLRCVPWSDRGRRFIASGQPGSFREEDLAVRNSDAQTPLVNARPKDARSELVGFGGTNDRRNRIVGSLAKKVREVYAREKLVHLHEIRVYEHALSRFRDGMYHLFWNNAVDTQDAPSDEMAMLLRAYAKPNRQKLGALWQQMPNFLMHEYEYEYGGMHRPYSEREQGRRRRTEILHPVYIDRTARPTLRVGHLTDVHVATRNDVYAENLRQSNVNVPFNNWNESFTQLYAAAKKDAEVILLTGDLVDYGRGHIGVAPSDPTSKSQPKGLGVGDDSAYLSDRNWFLFHYLLASGDAYEKPTYTILGNHDWRINPYPPFAVAGTPDPASLIHDQNNRLSPEARRDAIRQAHGPGWETKLSYDPKIEGDWSIKLRNAGRLTGQALRTFFAGQRTLDVPGFPTETNVDSVAWYLLAINPFLDYRVALPSGHDLLMLDWGEDETVIFGTIYQGKRYTVFNKHTADEGPTARNCLSDLQVAMVQEFTDLPGKAKLIGIHAPPIGPWDDWYEDELARGWKTFDMGGRGYPFYTRETRDGKREKGHPLFAIRPAKGVVEGAVFGMDASYNSFDENRPWFIRRVADASKNVRMVFSGHIHRAGLYSVAKAPNDYGPKVAGELLLKVVVPNRVSQTSGPLFLNSTSGGPRGHAYVRKGLNLYIDPGYTHVEVRSDGVVERISFRALGTHPTGLPAPMPAPRFVQPPRSTIAPRRVAPPVRAGSR